MQTQTSNTLHNAIMEAGSKDRPPMLAPGNYVQWKSRIKRYIDTKPNHELIHYCLTNPPYEFGWIDKEIPIYEGSPITRSERFQETYKNVSQEIHDQLNAKAEAVQIILTGIDNDIYSTVDDCPNACEMWKAIERLKQGESINVQDLETNLYWEFGKFTSQDGESLESYYSRIGNVAGARETVGSTTVQKSGIQCYNCKEFGLVAKECQKPKREKDAAYHREKMLLYQELKAHYMYMAHLQEVSPDDADFGPDEVNSRTKIQSHKTRDSNKPVDQKSHTQTPGRQIFTGHKFSSNKNFAVYKKTSPRSDLRWKPTGRIFKSVGFRWLPTGKLFDSCTSKVEREPTHGFNADTSNIHESKQTLDLSAGTSINVTTEQSLAINADDEITKASVHNSTDPAPSRQEMASAHDSSDPALTRQETASVYNSTNPGPKCQMMALEHNSLSPGRNCQENVSHRDKTGTTLNELDLLFSPMFDELLNGSSKVVSKSSVVSTADAPNQRLQPTTPLTNYTTPTPTCQNPPITTTVMSSENINQAEPHAENDQVADDEFINIFST
nr:hypothetical protein [Tanacetum cinerariifolium]